MANSLFDKAREAFANGDIDWTTATIKCSLVRGYTPSLSTHDFVDDVTGAGGTLVSTVTLASKTATDGVCDAADITFTAVAAGAACEHLLIYQASAVGGGADVAASAQRVIGLIDTATNLPFTPQGNDLQVTWDNGASKIFKL